MNSLLEKEGLAGQVQTIFMDPPYGIKFNSNFQPVVNQPNVSGDNNTNLSTDPGVIQAFRDTWELGIHSYLNYLRSRLILMRELLNDSGSCFVQINDTNQHYVRCLMDEIFGKENFISMIVYQTTTQTTSTLMPNLCDYIIWYAKDKKQVKYRQLYKQLTLNKERLAGYRVELADGSNRSLTTDEKLNPSTININTLYRVAKIKSRSSSTVFKFKFDGKVYEASWRTNEEGMENLKNKNRIIATANNIWFKQYYTDRNGYASINNIWSDVPPLDVKKFVVQSSPNAIQRCLQMSTDPGDLVIDPTCGSGTTAYVAEKLGRRWITIDTSRIAIQLARARLITSTYDWYKFAYEEKGISAGFQYQTIDLITLKSLANNDSPQKITLYDKPEKESNIIRVTGSFTVEAMPAPTITPLQDAVSESQVVDDNLARSGETVRQNDLRIHLENDGIIDAKNQKVFEFINVESMPAPIKYIHAIAETVGGEQVLIHFGQDNAPISPKIVKLVFDEVKTLQPTPNIILFAGFQFDPHAAQDIDNTKWQDIEILRTQINPDLTISDLKSNKKKATGQSFHLVGQPDLQIYKEDNKHIVEVRGFDYYNPHTGNVASGQGSDIAMWMLDTDYDGRSLLPTQVFFPMSDMQKDLEKLKELMPDIDEDLILKCKGLQSIPFASGDYQRCAVKIIDNKGFESLRIINLA